MENLNNAVIEATKRLSAESSYASMCRSVSSCAPMPSVRELRKFVNLCRDVIFPGYFEDYDFNAQTLVYHTGVSVGEIAQILSRQVFAGLCFMREEPVDENAMRVQAEEIAAKFVERLPELRELLQGDVVALYNGDPAAQCYGEIIFAYPALRTITNYRIAHLLQTLGVPLIPRVITEMAHSETGIDIHPEAVIGRNFAIDHGTGVVIGATCIIGNNVKLYQGVTLGAKSFPLDDDGNPIKGIPRHPIIEDNVVIYAQATILGRIRIGHDSTIGGNVWLTHDLEPGTVFTQRD